MEALAPFRAAFVRPPSDPAPLPYLKAPGQESHGAIDIALEVLIETPAMREAGMAPHRLSCSNFTHAYWTVAQMIAHHTVNGCNLQPGDLLASGTLSGPGAGEAGSLLELTHGGKSHVTLGNGETRAFLQDGDKVLLRGSCERPGRRRIGFGECHGIVLPARSI